MACCCLSKYWRSTPYSKSNWRFRRCYTSMWIASSGSIWRLRRKGWISGTGCLVSVRRPYASMFWLYCIASKMTVSHCCKVNSCTLISNPTNPCINHRRWKSSSFPLPKHRQSRNQHSLQLQLRRSRRSQQCRTLQWCSTQCDRTFQPATTNGWLMSCGKSARWSVYKLNWTRKLSTRLLRLPVTRNTKVHACTSSTKSRTTTSVATIPWCSKVKHHCCHDSRAQSE